jgi:purine nucleosidase
VHGESGLDGPALPDRASDPIDTHAVDFLVEHVTPETVLVPVGPLTNVALALERGIRPARIVLMGGAVAEGNMTPAAEFNFYADPHAAAVVFTAELPLVMLGLNATHQAITTSEHNAAFAFLGTATGRAVHGMLTRPRPGGLGTTAHPLHDPCVIAYLLWPELFTGRDCYVTVETSDGPLRGRSTVDWNGRLSSPANAFVVNTVDAPVLMSRMITELSTLP